jgi:branched-chain amino acid transport system ATP-binding protein
VSGSFVLEARGLTAGYGRESVIVRDLDLAVAAGEVVALLGPNGAGKTTTLLTLCGELPALGGDVWWRGAPTSAPFFRRARQGLGLVTEQRAVLMSMTVAENLRVSRCDRARALGLFPELGEHLNRRAGLLSGGQQQMLALARALARDTALLLVDELSLGLAPLVVDRLLDAVRAAADAGVGVLLVEQHVHKAMQVADRAYVMRRGRIRLSGTTAELRGRVEEIETSYLAADPDDVDE